MQVLEEVLDDHHIGSDATLLDLLHATIQDVPASLLRAAEGCGYTPPLVSISDLLDHVANLLIQPFTRMALKERGAHLENYSSAALHAAAVEGTLCFEHLIAVVDVIVERPRPRHPQACIIWIHSNKPLPVAQLGCSMLSALCIFSLKRQSAGRSCKIV